MNFTFRFFLGVLLFAQFSFAQVDSSNPALSLWDDPDFVKSFTLSYAVLSEYEPEVSDEEKQVLVGQLELIKSNPKAAISTLKPQVNSNSSAALDFILANLYFQVGDLGNAETYYRKAVGKYPRFRRAYKNLGLVLVQRGDLKAAAPVISSALNLGDVDGRSYGMLGYCYLSQELYYPAETAYRQAILMQPKVRDWKLGLGRCLLELEHHDAAIALFDTLIKADPDVAEYWLLQANAYIGKNDVVAASSNIEVVQRMGLADVNALMMLGDIYMHQELAELALGAYLKALKVSGDTNTRALIYAAKLFTDTANVLEAKTLMQRLRKQMGVNLPEEYDLKLMVLEAKVAGLEGDLPKQFELLKKIVERDSLNGDALIELGDYYADQGDLPRAINRYEQAQLISGAERSALIAHGQTLVRNDLYEEALVLLKRALEMKADPYLADYVERLERASR